MGIILAIAGTIAGIVVLVLVIALFIGKDYTVRQKITIDRPSQAVFDYIKYQRNQQYFSKWVMIDPASVTYIGTDAAVGFILAWDSENKNAGKGEQEITTIIDGKRIDCEIRFERPFKNVAYTSMETNSISVAQTEFTWALKGKNPYPMNIMNLFIPKMLAADIDQSLLTLKGILEK